MSPPLNIGILASHTGTTLQSIIDACENGILNARCRVVISNNSTSLALERARRHSIPAFHLSSSTHPTAEALDSAIKQTLLDHEVDLVVLAGYMKLLGPKTLRRFHNRVVNTHPALLPEFGGRGMYGDNVHRAVLKAGLGATGVTVHLVDEIYDHGPILAQTQVPILPNDTLETLRDRVQTTERRFYVETLHKIATNQIPIPPSHMSS